MADDADELGFKGGEPSSAAQPSRGDYTVGPSPLSTLPVKGWISEITSAHLGAENGAWAGLGPSVRRLPPQTGLCFRTQPSASNSDCRLSGERPLSRTRDACWSF
jgi:hypothetical protein